MVPPRTVMVLLASTVMVPVTVGVPFRERVPPLVTTKEPELVPLVFKERLAPLTSTVPALVKETPPVTVVVPLTTNKVPPCSPWWRRRGFGCRSVKALRRR